MTDDEAGNVSHKGTCAAICRDLLLREIGHHGASLRQAGFAEAIKVCFEVHRLLRRNC